MDGFLDLIKQRYSCRNYADRPLEREKVEACIEAARMAPSACNSQPWYFAVATDRETVRALAKTTQKYGLNEFTDQVPVLVTVWEDQAVLIPVIRDVVDSQHYAPGDVGIATTYLTLAAAELGLGTCIIGIHDEAETRNLLSVPEGKKLRYVIAMGYPAQGSKVPNKGRKLLDQISQF